MASGLVLLSIGWMNAAALHDARQIRETDHGCFDCDWMLGCHVGMPLV